MNAPMALDNDKLEVQIVDLRDSGRSVVAVDDLDAGQLIHSEPLHHLHDQPSTALPAYYPIV
jgi:hypothetical protein